MGQYSAAHAAGDARVSLPDRLHFAMTSALIRACSRGCGQAVVDGLRVRPQLVYLVRLGHLDVGAGVQPCSVREIYKALHPDEHQKAGANIATMSKDEIVDALGAEGSLCLI